MSQLQTTNQKLKELFRKSIDSIVGIARFKLVRYEPYKDYRNYIPFQSTLKAATEAGLSVGDYIDSYTNVKGTTQKTLIHMKELGVFDDRIERFCEIGPGTGRYLEKVIQISQPDYCEIYETAKDWEAWLVQKYNVIAQPADGTSLAKTPSNSIDLIQAHKVLSGQPTLVICSYLGEMTRVVRERGKVVFDVVTEDCMDDETLHKWWASGWGYQHYPCMMPKRFVIDFFKKRNFSLGGSFILPMKPGKTECFVFIKAK